MGTKNAIALQNSWITYNDIRLLTLHHALRLWNRDPPGLDIAHVRRQYCHSSVTDLPKKQSEIVPANKKYLTKSKWQKTAKISAAVLGGYLISLMAHLVLSMWLPDHRTVLITLQFSLYLLWIVLFIIPFLFRNGWKCWLIYGAVILVLGAAIVVEKMDSQIT